MVSGLVSGVRVIQSVVNACLDTIGGWGPGWLACFRFFPVHVYWAVAFTSSVAVVLGLYAEMKT